MVHHFLIRGSGCASLVHYSLRRGTFNHATAGRPTAHFKMRTLSATIVPMKSPYEGGVEESLPSKVSRLLPAHRVQMLEKRTAAFGNIMLHEEKSAALRECKLNIGFALMSPDAYADCARLWSDLCDRLRSR